MKDQLGQELSVDDYCFYWASFGSSSIRYSIVKIDSLTDKRVRVYTTYVNSRGYYALLGGIAAQRRAIFIVTPGRLIKLNEEQLDSAQNSLL
jgi:hypothetical protein